MVRGSGDLATGVGVALYQGGLSGDHDGYCSAAYRKKGSGDVHEPFMKAGQKWKG